MGNVATLVADYVETLNCGKDVSFSRVSDHPEAKILTVHLGFESGPGPVFHPGAVCIVALNDTEMSVRHFDGTTSVVAKTYSADKPALDATSLAAFLNANIADYTTAP